MIRTSDKLYLAAKSAGYIYKEKIEQCFDQDKQMFLADRYVTGECPKCSAQNQYGDGCDRCGSTLSPDELIDPKSTLSGEKPILKETTHWYLPMQKHEEWLKPCIWSF